jgi:hypothetical protein
VQQVGKQQEDGGIGQQHPHAPHQGLELGPDGLLRAAAALLPLIAPLPAAIAAAAATCAGACAAHEPAPSTRLLAGPWPAAAWLLVGALAAAKQVLWGKQSNVYADQHTMSYQLGAAALRLVVSCLVERLSWTEPNGCPHH